MSDSDKVGFSPVQPAPELQGSNPAGEGATKDSPVEEKGVALTEARVNEIVEKAVEGVLRKAQSITKKAEDRIKAEVAAKIEDMKAAGITPTPEQEKQLESVVRQRETSSSTAEGRPPTQGKAESSEPTDPVTQAGYELMDQYGIDIEKEDPESEKLDFSSPLKYLRSLEDALKTKAARVGQVRAPVGSGGSAANPIKNIRDLDELYRMSTKK